MIHPINLLLGHHLEQAGIERARRIEVMAERLFDDDTPPTAVLLLGQTGLGQHIDDWPKQGARNREIEHDIPGGAMLRFCRLEGLLELVIQLRIGDIAFQTAHSRRKKIPGARVKRFDDRASRRVRHEAAPSAK
jgi:hypothetical protein